MTPVSTRLATFFGVGWIKIAPGTFGSAAALPFGFLLVLAGVVPLIAASVIVTIVGIWACGAHAQRTGVTDPSECVLDEVAGQWFALIPAALEMRHDWRIFAMAFFLFRVFDITKPWPIGPMERLPGGFGIMLDDVLAGLVAALCLYGMLAIGLL